MKLDARLFHRQARRHQRRIEADFRPAVKAHPALLVDDLAAILARARTAGAKIAEDEPLPGYVRAFVFDPFGNRIELMEPRSA